MNNELDWYEVLSLLHIVLGALATGLVVAYLFYGCIWRIDLAWRLYLATLIVGCASFSTGRSRVEWWQLVFDLYLSWFWCKTWESRRDETRAS